MVADNKNRAIRRSTQVMCRMTPEEREELKVLATEAGVTVQTFILRKVFDRPDAQDVPHGRRTAASRREDMELRMTG